MSAAWRLRMEKGALFWPASTSQSGIEGVARPYNLIM